MAIWSDSARSASWQRRLKRLDRSLSSSSCDSGGGRQASRNPWRVFLSLCLSIFAAAEINGVVKVVFGRTWAESWQGGNSIVDSRRRIWLLPLSRRSWMGLLSFLSYDSRRDPATILWVVWPELKTALATTLVALVVAGLIGSNCHFVSDTISGLYLGAAIGLGTVAVMLSPNDLLSWSTALSSVRPEEPPS
jgi:hypothetical protein